MRLVLSSVSSLFAFALVACSAPAGTDSIFGAPMNANGAASTSHADAGAGDDDDTSDPGTLSTNGQTSEMDGSADDAASTTPPSMVDDAAAPAPVYPPIDTSAMAPCASSGNRAFAVDGATCFNFTPANAGASASGANANQPNFAIRPTAKAPSGLVIFFIGSGGQPSGALRSDPALNVYGAAVAQGRAVLGIAYSNVQSLGMLCGHTDACYFPSRQEILLGEPISGSAITVAHDEGVVDRVAHALRYLASGDPTGNWGSFLTTLDPTADAKSTIVWKNVIAAGHSQGGGHAAAVGKLFPVMRVIQFSSTCDTSDTDGTPVSWTNGKMGTWATDPTHFFGLGAPADDGSGTGDQTCPYHTANWDNLGMTAAYRNDDAEICGVTGDTHGQSIQCSDNYPYWTKLFQ